MTQNLSLRSMILIGVCLQNAGYTLIRKYSTMTEDVSSKEILFMGEAIKMVVSGYLLLDNAETQVEVSSAQGRGTKRLRWLVEHSGKMFVLAMIYAAMNILSFVALQYIGAGEFTICAQLKILTTAGFSVIVLRTSLSWTKWRALVQLVLGCILVASPNFVSEAAASGVTGESEDIPTGSFLKLLGYGAVLTEVVLSGFASIYFERVVKSTTEVVTIWERNFQLAMYSMVVYICYIFYDKYITGERQEIGANWSSVTFFVSCFGALGGLLVAATLKYADSILKTMAAAGAIVVSTLLGHWWMDGPLDMITCMGGITTIISIMNYSWDCSANGGGLVARERALSVGTGPFKEGSNGVIPDEGLSLLQREEKRNIA